MIGLREFGDDKADVIMKYYEEEARELKELQEIPEHVKINEGEFFDEKLFERMDDAREKVQTIKEITIKVFMSSFFNRNQVYS